MNNMNMNILVIKQTSLGDVLHSTGHVRAIKQNFPESHITVLTATGSADIYRNNPHVDEIILFNRNHPQRWEHFRETVRRVRARRFHLAFDLQGLARTVIFLYAARARKKYVKGRWLGLRGFRGRKLHAIAEMDRVLQRAGLQTADTTMEWFGAQPERKWADEWMAKHNPRNLPILLCSPFSRWRSKDWPLANYMQIALQLSKSAEIAAIFCGDANAQTRLDIAMPGLPNFHNLAGKLTLLQFAELLSRAKVSLSGDSFPMHLAHARGIPIVAFFAPTDENRTAPRGYVGYTHSAAAAETTDDSTDATETSADSTETPANSTDATETSINPISVFRPPDCKRCDRRICRRRCLEKLPAEVVLPAVEMAVLLDR